jgi:hypothetical protein
MITPDHIISQWSNSCASLSGVRAVLIRSAAHYEWFGWLPWDELEVDGVEFGDAF